jgi:hypothetical protein
MFVDLNEIIKWIIDHFDTDECMALDTYYECEQMKKHFEEKED